MLHNEARKLVLEAWDKTHNAKEIAKYFSVNESTIYRFVEEHTGRLRIIPHSLPVTVKYSVDSVLL